MRSFVPRSECSSNRGFVGIECGPSKGFGMIKWIASSIAMGLVGLVVACGGSSDNDTFSPMGGAAGSAGASGGSGGSGQSSGGSSSKGGSSSSGGSTGGSVAAGGSGGNPLTNVPVDLATVVCHRLYECCTPDELMGNLVAGGTEQDCVVIYGGFVGLLVAAVQPSISAGRIAYHDDAFDSCIPALGEIDCATLRAGTDDPAAAQCGVVFEPLVAMGGACTQHGECINGWCETAAGSAEGQCAPKKADGIECVDDGECISDYCDFVEGVCAAEPAGGGFCGGG